MFESSGGFDNPVPETSNDPNAIMVFRPLVTGTSSFHVEDICRSQRIIEDPTRSLGLEAPLINGNGRIWSTSITNEQ